MKKEMPDFSNVQGGSSSTAPSENTYEVQASDSLSKIAKRAYGDANEWNRIFEANKDILKDPNKIYDTNDLAPGKKIIFAATGVTDGALLRGVRFFGAGKRTHSVVMTTDSKSIRFVDTVHVEGGPDAVIRF